MPKKCMELALVTIPNGEGIIAVGCENTDIYRLVWKDENTLEWSTMTQKLKYKRYENAAAMYIPNDMVTCNLGN